MAVEDEAGGVPASAPELVPAAEVPAVVEPEAVVVAEAIVEPAALNAHEEPTLLEAASTPKKEEAPAADAADAKSAETPTDAPKPDEAKPAEAAVETPAPPVETPVAFEKFKVPEEFRVDDARMTELSGLLGQPRTQENAQAIVNLGLDQMRMYAEHLGQEQHRVWADTRKGWVSTVKADPELGGAGFETSMAKIGRMRDLFVTQADQQAFNDFLRVTGAGDHPAFLRLMYRVSQKFDEGTAAPAPANPVPDRGGRGRTRGAPGRVGAVLYDNTRSQ